MENKLPTRKRLRIIEYDYSKEGMYFITISRMIKQYKGYVSKKVGYASWQKSFYEHIIRNEKEYIKIKDYIKNNIRNWKEDRYF